MDAGGRAMQEAKTEELLLLVVVDISHPAWFSNDPMGVVCK